MSDESANPSCISHLSIGTNDFPRARAFYDAVMAAGARDEGAPGPRPLYGEPYYGCFIRDLDGHKVEASYWDMSQGFDAHDHAH
ncbi:TPA: hypothetical protein SLU29_002569 [Pseudomonas aeruginosa]|nr:hypothetical protein [Pseudomonas aeruginosa]